MIRHLGARHFAARHFVAIRLGVAVQPAISTQSGAYRLESALASIRDRERLAALKLAADEQDILVFIQAFIAWRDVAE